MLTGRLEIIVKETEQGKMGMETHIDMREESEGPQEKLYDLTMLIHTVLTAMKVDTQLEAIMLSEAIRRNDWWGADPLPYTKVDNSIESKVTFDILRTVSEEVLAGALIELEHKMARETEEANESRC